MAFNAYDEERSGSSLTMPIITGATVARLVGITDLGVQPQDGFGEKRPPRRELNLTFECTTKFMLDSEGNEVPDKPCWLYDTIKLYHPSAENAKSTDYAKKLDPKNKCNFNFLDMLGLPIILEVGKNTAGKDNKIIGRTTMLEGMPVGELVNEPFYFDLNEGDDGEKFQNLPDWVQEKIQSSIGFHNTPFALSREGGAGNFDLDGDEDLPF